MPHRPLGQRQPDCALRVDALNRISLILDLPSRHVVLRGLLGEGAPLSEGARRTEAQIAHYPGNDKRTNGSTEALVTRDSSHEHSRPAPEIYGEGSCQIQ